MRTTLNAQLRVLCVALRVALLCVVGVVDAVQQPWSNVALGGGGYVTGLVVHPTTPNLWYIRTDVGGAYINNGTDGWISITDDFKLFGYMGVDGIAIDPLDDNVVYIAVGIYNWAPGCLMKSINRGQTWNCTFKTPGNANGNEARYAGERIYVDAVNSSRVIFGTRYEGVKMSTNGAGNFNSVTDIPKANSYGVSWIAADPTTSVTTPYRYTKRLFLTNANDSIYMTENGGQTWSSIGGPLFPWKGAVSPDGKYLYAAGALNNLTGEGVSRYDIVNAKWEDISPPFVGRGYKFCGIAVHSSVPGLVYTTTHYTTNPDIVYRSTDYGKTWENISQNFTKVSDVTWWRSNEFNVAISSFTIDPKDGNRAWMTDFTGTWMTNNLTSPKPHWFTYEKGHEELDVMHIVSIPGGYPLLSGHADVLGFYHTDMDQYPVRRSGIGGDVINIEYAALNTSLVVAAWTTRYINAGGAAYSENFGRNWTQFPTQIGKAGRVVLSADGKRILWFPMETDKAYISLDKGKNWTQISIPNFQTTFPNLQVILCHSLPLAADKVDSNIFYFAQNDRFYRSEDGGSSFAIVSTVQNSTIQGFQYGIVATPGKTKDIWYWVAPDSKFSVLNHSIDGGNTWTTVANVTNVYQISFGKNRNNDLMNTLYILGAVNNSFGVFRSEDFGNTWTAYNVTGLPIPLLKLVAGCSNEFGKVYVGSDGRGIFYTSANEAGGFTTTTGTTTTTTQVSSGPFPTSTTGEHSSASSMGVSAVILLVILSLTLN